MFGMRNTNFVALPIALVALFTPNEALSAPPPETRAAPAQPHDTVVVEGTKPADEKKVCRVERETGSHMVKQVCKSASDRRKEARDSASALQTGNRSNKPPDAFKPPRSN
jgi:hypothetical protein